MEWWPIWMVLAGAAAAGCGAPCAPSSDVQITLFAGPGVDASQATRLLIDLQIDGAASRRAELPLTESFDRRAFLLRPDMPASVAYTVAVSVQAVDGSGQVLGIGGASGRVEALGCNRLEATLTAMITGGDLAAMPDLGKACGPGSPDEDNDGIADDCDACPADADPGMANSDGDALPDACDPDSTRAGNVQRLFEPFNAAGTRWSGPAAISTGELVLSSTRDPVLASDTTDVLAANLRVEAWLQAAYFLTVRGMPIRGEVGVFVGDTADPATANAGMLCVLTHAASGADSLDLYRFVGGAATLRTTIALSPLFATATTYRLRLDERGGAFRCEAASNGLPTTAVTDTVAAPSAGYHLSLYAAGTEAHFAAVFAASTLP